MAIHHDRDRAVLSVRAGKPGEEQPEVTTHPEGNEVLLTREIVGVALAFDARP